MAVAVNGVLPLGALVEPHIAGVVVHTGNDRASSLLVEELTVVVVPDGNNHPVARFECLTDGWP